jgi:hypothetical protein
MSLPPFLTRNQNAAGPLLGGLGESELGDRLRRTSLHLEIDAERASDPAHRAAYLLATNLGARLYPRLSLDAPEDLIAPGRELARAINPNVTFGPPRGRCLCISWRGGEPAADRVTVSTEGWNVSLDGSAPASTPANPLAALAAAALGMGELFRSLFADRLAHPRGEPNPFAISLLTLGAPSQAPPLPERIELGTVHLAGCGAVGQAFAATLRELPVTGELFAVDHESLDEGNLQRYLLGIRADVGTAKPLLIERALAESELTVQGVESLWGSDPRCGPGRETVVAALDTKQGRIELQAGLPRELFNAWTQPADIGVSRHQNFGTDPCLACLGWPKGSRPSRSEAIATALGEHELRVVHYLGHGVPVGQPLPSDAIQPTGRLALPKGSDQWAHRSLLDDLIKRHRLSPEPFEDLAGLALDALYRDAVCAGMLIEHGSDRDAEVSVPLAHQSALAGILLATWLIVDRVPQLRELRPAETQARYDMLRGGDQVWPRGRTTTERCICGDRDYLAAYAERWSGPSSTDAPVSATDLADSTPEVSSRKPEAANDKEPA